MINSFPNSPISSRVYIYLFINIDCVETKVRKMPPYKHLSPEEVNHFLTKGWLCVPGAIKEEYIDKWMQDLWVRIGYDEHDKSTWHSDYLHLPRHREVPAERFAPEAWDKIVEICGGEDRIDPVRERYYGDAFIINFGSSEKASQINNSAPFRPQDLGGWHTDDDWYRMFLDSSGNALTVIHAFTDIPAGGGGTCVCEDALKGRKYHLNPNLTDTESLNPTCTRCCRVSLCPPRRP